MLNTYLWSRILFYCSDKFVYDLWEAFENDGHWFGPRYYDALDERTQEISYLWSPEYFVEACRKGELKEVKNYIDCGVIEDCTQGLIAAIRAQKCDVIRFLLKNDSNDHLGEDNGKVWSALLEHWDDYSDLSPVFKVVRKYKPDLADAVNLQIERELMRSACDITGEEFDSDEYSGGRHDFV